MDDALHERVDALERAVTDGDGDLAALADAAEHAGRIDQLANDIAELQEQVAELEAATQALRGYVGNIRSVNRDVEKRAETALATAEALEATLQDAPKENATGEDAPTSSSEDDESAMIESAIETAPSNATGQQATRPADESTTIPGKPAPTTANADHCPECGHNPGTTETPPRREVAVHQQPPGNGSEPRNGVSSGESPDQINRNGGALTPETPAKTGTFQRIRELL